jgi:hypothetical protein
MIRMPDDRTSGDHIAECARHQHCESGLFSVYSGLSDEDRSALARMTTDADQRDARRWTHPPDEL